MSLVGRIEPIRYHRAVGKLRQFFDQRGYVEVCTQNRRSILAACEDPKTMATYNYAGQIWPLPQTGQMWLEYELLKNPGLKGVYCTSISYRNEPAPIPGRHDTIFPMFEFESKGDMEDMIRTEAELLYHLGFRRPENSPASLYTPHGFPRDAYVNVAGLLNVQDIGHEEEMEIRRRFGKVFFLTDFPATTSPFWNMARRTDKQTAKKCDVIIHGIETIGSAERSCDVDEMRRQFFTISNGQYAEMLFNNFTRQRVEDELNDFFALKFFPRYGGGIGLTRLIRALELNETP